MAMPRGGSPKVRSYINVEKKPRLCLKCQAEFMSLGSWNRICPTCNYENQKLGNRRLGKGEVRRKGFTDFTHT